MTHSQPYRPFPTCPHTYGVRHCLSSAIATEPCRPTACVRERPCSPNGESGLGETPSYRASAPNGAGDVGSRSTVHCSLLTVHWTFTFSAKERDPETGLSYFGSRYYSSDLSIWLSVDPQSDKYASLSPYVYCADNPVKLVDPNGEDIWEIDENGKLTWKGHNDKVDILYATKTRESKDFPIGTIKEMTNDRGGCNYDGQTITVEFQYLDINDDELANCFFEFVGENTDVEWSLTQTGEHDNRIARDVQYTNKAGERLDISLSNGSGSVLLKRYFENNVSVRAAKHSHPLGKYIVPDPSGYDRGVKYWFMKHFNDKANIIYEVYGKKDGRWQYMPY